MAEHDTLSTLSLEILTPEKPFLIKEVALVVVPSQEGDCGVMAGMAPLLCALRAGVVCLFDEQLDVVERHFVLGGTAWITRERVVLLVDEVTELARIDTHAIKEEIDKIKKQDSHDPQTLLMLEGLRQKRLAVADPPYS